MATAPHRPALRYFGGNWRLAPWVIEHFPPHVCYEEAFAGAFSVGMRKKRCRFEYYNDVDGRVVNFFRQLRDNLEEFKRLVSLTPFSREEFVLARSVAADPLEDARRFYVLMWQGRGGHEHSTGWRFQRVHARSKTARRDWFDTSHLDAVVERLREVQLENDDVFAVMRRFDGPDTLHYLDPPFLAETRGKSVARYRREMKDPEEHKLFLALCVALEGFVVLRHPRCPLYEDLLGDWGSREKSHLTGGRTADGGGTTTTETLWLNPRCVAAQVQVELNFEAA